MEEREEGSGKKGGKVRGRGIGRERRVVCTKRGEGG